MLSRWIFYLLLLIGEVFLTAFFETWLTGFILALTLALPLLSLLLSLPIMLGTSVCLLPPGQTVTYGAPIRFWSVRFQNRFPLSVARVRMQVHIQNLDPSSTASGAPSLTPCAAECWRRGSPAFRFTIIWDCSGWT